MAIRIHFRDKLQGDAGCVSEVELREFESRIRELFSSFPSDAVGCCCVISQNQGVAFHLVVRSKSGRFEGSVSAENINRLYQALWKHFQPQLTKWRAARFRKNGGQVIRMNVSENYPLKRKICSEEKCPIFHDIGFWPGRVDKAMPTRK